MRPRLSFLGCSTPDATVLGAFHNGNPTTDESTTNNRMVKYKLVCTHCRFETMHYKQNLTTLRHCPRCRCKWEPFDKAQAKRLSPNTADWWHGHFTVFHLADGEVLINRGRPQEAVKQMPPELVTEWRNAGSRIGYVAINLTEWLRVPMLPEEDSQDMLQGRKKAPTPVRVLRPLELEGTPQDPHSEVLLRHQGMQGHRIEDVPENLGFLTPPIEMNWTLVKADFPPEKQNSIAYVNPNYYWVYKTDAVEIGSDEKLFDF